MTNCKKCGEETKLMLSPLEYCPKCAKEYFKEKQPELFKKHKDIEDKIQNLEICKVCNITKQNHHLIDNDHAFIKSGRHIPLTDYELEMILKEHSVIV